jgi:hypothetical protein
MLIRDEGHRTLRNLTAAYKALDRAGALLYPADHAHPIKEAQRLRAEQYAANGDVLGGIVEYVKSRISDEGADQIAFRSADPLAFTTDPEMRPILEDACWFCWEAYRKNFSPLVNDAPFCATTAPDGSLQLTYWTTLGKKASESRRRRRIGVIQSSEQRGLTHQMPNS